MLNKKFTFSKPAVLPSSSRQQPASSHGNSIGRATPHRSTAMEADAEDDDFQPAQRKPSSNRGKSGSAGFVERELPGMRRGESPKPLPRNFGQFEATASTHASRMTDTTSTSVEASGHTTPRPIPPVALRPPTPSAALTATTFISPPLLPSLPQSHPPRDSADSSQPTSTLMALKHSLEEQRKDLAERILDGGGEMDSKELGDLKETR
ncbi:hypothetical protein M427DRAFT_279927 [Gonapodya prolifera JEL478]|uniref:Uncharacterized protein n=1 Tax=Gonapodya prolifera (strain JEL478) TaxID=1344416 RepID=A0A139AZD0_GONPJ|nr:hypothetical protein M427DRAFT_279927 [Gonapodya prolifera JEL478]|eukprot:KXS21835.1 hypothetical protein M427DRAFT_279927 [Gonapodya prolifera JEL478]